MIFIGLIPARSGSKGIKNKNLVSLSGRPLIDFTVKAAIESKKITTTYISSDSDEILSAADSNEIKKIIRPENFSNDAATANDVIKHFISLNHFENYDGISMVYLQPTSPLRNVNHINEAIEIFEASDSRSLISIKPSSELPYKAFKLKDNKLYPLFNEESLTANRQTLPKTFYPNGAIYIFELNAFIQNNFQIPVSDCVPFLMDQDESVDIDSHLDLIVAEIFLSSKEL
jgi:CMP-N-acetylneuraminic acid synthetase